MPCSLTRLSKHDPCTLARLMTQFPSRVLTSLSLSSPKTVIAPRNWTGPTGLSLDGSPVNARIQDQGVTSVAPPPVVGIIRLRVCEERHDNRRLVHVSRPAAITVPPLCPSPPLGASERGATDMDGPTVTAGRHRRSGTVRLPRRSTVSVRSAGLCLVCLAKSWIL